MFDEHTDIDVIESLTETFKYTFLHNYVIMNYDNLIE